MPGFVMPLNFEWHCEERPLQVQRQQFVSCPLLALHQMSMEELEAHAYSEAVSPKS